MSTLLYLKTFMKDKQVAAITPTSTFGIKDVCSKVNLTNCETIVEYGPATGVFTSYILQNMRKDARLILIEMNKDFVNVLKSRFKDDRITIFNDSAENVQPILNSCGSSEADCIISGIPFSWIPDGVKQKIICDTYKSLKDGGKFLAYQTFYQKNSHLKAYLENYFSTVNDQYELRNIPPLRIYEAIK